MELRDAISAVQAVQEWERQYYGTLAFANRLLIPAIVIGVAGNLLLWLWG